MKRTLLSMTVMLVACIVLYGQHHVNQKTDLSIEIIGEMPDSMANPYEILLENTPVDPEYTVPHFAIVDKNQRFYMSLGARIKAVGVYDWGNPTNPTDFKPSEFVEASPGNERDLQMSIKSSSLNFNVVGMPRNKYRVGIFMALTFDGGENNKFMAKCDYGYIKCAGFSLGYQSSLYDDKAADVYLIDGNGPGASGFHSNMSINYQRHITRNLKAGISLEMPRLSMTVRPGQDEKNDVEINQNIPDVPVYVQWGWDDISHVRLSAVYRSLSYRDVVENCNRTLPGYGVKLTASMAAGPTVMYVMAQSGKGIANYMKDNDNHGLDLVPSDAGGRYRRTSSWGGLWGLQYDFNPRMFSSLSYGYMRNYVDAYAGGSVEYLSHLKYEHYAAVNFIWKISEFVNLGMEYNYGIRKDFGGESIHNNRISAMMKVGF